MRLLLWSRIGLAALLAAAGCEYEEASTAKKEKTEITIPSGECASVCGGQICYTATHIIEPEDGYESIRQKCKKPEEGKTKPGDAELENICAKLAEEDKKAENEPKEKRKLQGYSITANGFEDYFTLNKKMIFADECVFYRGSLDAGKLVLEKLR